MAEENEYEGLYDWEINEIEQIREDAELLAALTDDALSAEALGITIEELHAQQTAHVKVVWQAQKEQAMVDGTWDYVLCGIVRQL